MSLDEDIENEEKKNEENNKDDKKSKPQNQDFKTKEKQIDPFLFFENGTGTVD